MPTDYTSITKDFNNKQIDFSTLKFNDDGSSNANGANTIYDLEKKLIDAINVFYTKYATHIRCGSSSDDGTSGKDDQTYNRSTYQSSMNSNNYQNNMRKNICTSSEKQINKSDVDTAQTAVKIAANALARAINSINNGNTSFTMATFNQNHQALLNNYSNNLNLRNELDLKMKEILKNDYAFVNQSKLHYDSTMYASIGWTILATSLLYYVFRKL